MSRPIVINRRRPLFNIVEEIDLHIEYISPMVDDIDRKKFITEILLGKINGVGSYFSCLNYIYTTSAFNTRTGYKHFEHFDDMIADIFGSDTLDRLANDLKFIINEREFELEVRLEYGEVLLWLNV